MQWFWAVADIAATIATEVALFQGLKELIEGSPPTTLGQIVFWAIAATFACLGGYGLARIFNGKQT